MTANSSLIKTISCNDLFIIHKHDVIISYISCHIQLFEHNDTQNNFELFHLDKFIYILFII